jgi:hypothetical protein
MLHSQGSKFLITVYHWTLIGGDDVYTQSESQPQVIQGRLAISVADGGIFKKNIGTTGADELK